MNPQNPFILIFNSVSVVSPFHQHLVTMGCHKNLETGIFFSLPSPSLSPFFLFFHPSFPEISAYDKITARSQVKGFSY